ncbi:MAG: hypothetical protein GY810_30780 [Aureispira sp.]|nr:hypothetical protein [Aureispira sp.]
MTREEKAQKLKDEQLKQEQLSALKPQLESLKECEAMVSYARSQGKPIPQEVLQTLDSLRARERLFTSDIKEGVLGRSTTISIGEDELGSVYNALSETISPAMPSSVILMENTKNAGGLRLLGPVPLVRKMMVVTIICLFSFLGMFFFEEVSPETINGPILSYPPLKFALNELVIVCVAALGASFYALFEAYKYIAKGSYDSKYDSIYWIRFTLGIVSGVILAQFIFAESDTGGNLLTEAGEGGGFVFTKTLLAFLGGFSARVVHKILNSLVDSIETFISGSTRDLVRAREEAAKVKLQDKLASIKQENAAKESVDRIRSTMQLMQLQTQLKNGASGDYVNNKVQEMIDSLMKPVNGEGLYEDVTFNNNNSNNPPFVPPTIDDNFQPPTVNDNPPVITNGNGGEVNDNFDMPNEDSFNIPNEDSFDIPDFGDTDNPDKPFPGDFDDKGNPPV